MSCQLGDFSPAATRVVALAEQQFPIVYTIDNNYSGTILSMFIQVVDDVELIPQQKQLMQL